MESLGRDHPACPRTGRKSFTWVALAMTGETKGETNLYETPLASPISDFDGRLGQLVHMGGRFSDLRKSSRHRQRGCSTIKNAHTSGTRGTCEIGDN